MHQSSVSIRTYFDSLKFPQSMIFLHCNAFVKLYDIYRPRIKKILQVVTDNDYDLFVAKTQ